MARRNKLIIFTALSLTLTLALLLPVFQESSDKSQINIILMIGDGMGTGQITAARISLGERLNLDKLRFAGLVTTHSYDNLVTDSAAAATALATGFKTRNGMVAVDPEGNNLTTVLEIAKSLGMSTGLVTTTRITHATPAAFASHVLSRSMEDDIALQLIENGVDVLLGGGRKFFIPEEEGGSRKDGRNLVKEAMMRGYTYVEDRGSLLKATKSDKLLGLFSLDNMSFDRQRDGLKEPSLAEMTRVALKVLSRNPRGFFLMVEGGRIDHASHSNDIDNTVGDMLAFDHAVKVALKFAKKHRRTLLVVTADHETGGLSVTPGPLGELSVRWLTNGHTGNMVPIYSYGFMSKKFSGTMDNTEIGKKLIRLVEKHAGSPVFSGSIISEYRVLALTLKNLLT